MAVWTRECQKWNLRPKLGLASNFRGGQAIFPCFRNFGPKNRKKSIFRFFDLGFRGQRDVPASIFFLQCVQRGRLSRNQYQNPVSIGCISQKSASKIAIFYLMGYTMEIRPIFRLSENVAKITQEGVVEPAESIAPIFRSILPPKNPQSAIFGNFGYFFPLFDHFWTILNCRQKQPGGCSRPC